MVDRGKSSGKDPKLINRVRSCWVGIHISDPRSFFCLSSWQFCLWKAGRWKKRKSGSIFQNSQVWALLRSFSGRPPRSTPLHIRQMWTFKNFNQVSDKAAYTDVYETIQPPRHWDSWLYSTDEYLRGLWIPWETSSILCPVMSIFLGESPWFFIRFSR